MMKWRYMFLGLVAASLLAFGTHMGQRAVFPLLSAEAFIRQDGLKSVNGPSWPKTEYRLPASDPGQWYVVNGGGIASLPGVMVSPRFASVVAELSLGRRVFLVRGPFAVAVVKRSAGDRVWVFDTDYNGAYARLRRLRGLAQDADPMNADMAIGRYDCGDGVYVLPETLYLRLAVVEDRAVVTTLLHYEVFTLNGGRSFRTKRSIGNGLTPIGFAWMLD
jgi:hypothetical protein